MTEKHIEYAKHCIGLSREAPYRRNGRLFYKPYRNYYYAGPGDIQTWEELVEAGYAYRNGDNWYHLTEKGMEWLGSIMEINIHKYSEN